MLMLHNEKHNAALKLTRMECFCAVSAFLPEVQNLEPSGKQEYTIFDG